jgi:hypothetical protein
MKVAIMQPYFFPYIGYFQLIESVDLFIVYDNIKYTKKGWINRNRIQNAGREAAITLPVKHAPDHLDIREREIAGDFARDKLLSRIAEAYRRAPYFGDNFPLLSRIVENREANLFRYLYDSIVKTCQHLGIRTRFMVSSEISVDHSLRHESRVLAMCAAVRADTYVNAIGGITLYSQAAFAGKGIDLRFIRSKPLEYDQGGGPFLPWLSIVDVMMFNSPGRIREVIASSYELIEQGA